MASLIRVPIDLRAPEQTGIAGNSFWTIQSGTASQFGYWAFLGNYSGGSGTGIRATGAIVYGFVQVPSNADPNSVPTVIVSLATTATANAVATFRVGSREIQTGQTYDVTSFVNINSQNWTAEATGWSRKDLTFTISGTTADAMIAIKIERPITASGSGNDNMTALVGCFDAWLQITATA